MDCSLTQILQCGGKNEYQPKYYNIFKWHYLISNLPLFFTEFNRYSYSIPGAQWNNYTGLIFQLLIKLHEMFKLRKFVDCLSTHDSTPSMNENNAYTLFLNH